MRSHEDWAFDGCVSRYDAARHDGLGPKGQDVLTACFGEITPLAREVAVAMVAAGDRVNGWNGMCTGREMAGRWMAQFLPPTQWTGRRTEPLASPYRDAAEQVLAHHGVQETDLLSRVQPYWLAFEKFRI